ncbi:hypothetical protein BBJ28_00009983 [Nothophytophthora sp. Chile5]|nr:hypothetical protein BBJ28_00009983 [Nothophytophthora sp. Chile5]
MSATSIRPASSTSATATPASDASGEGDDEEFDEDNPQWAKWDCDQVRKRVREYLGTKEMTQTAFLKLIQVNSNSYYRFMQLKGPYSGINNGTHEGASIFFYRRERDATKKAEAVPPQMKKRKAVVERNEKVKKMKNGDDLLQRITEVQLEGAREDGSLPVYDDCDELRKKIELFLGEKMVTKAALLRALGNLNTNSLRQFLSAKRGPGSGAANVTYREGYVFFEKKRILEGKPKTKKRLDNEAKLGSAGFPLRHDDGRRWVITPTGYHKKYTKRAKMLSS